MRVLARLSSISTLSIYFISVLTRLLSNNTLSVYFISVLARLSNINTLRIQALTVVSNAIFFESLGIDAHHGHLFSLPALCGAQTQIIIRCSDLSWVSHFSLFQVLCTSAMQGSSDLVSINLTLIIYLGSFVCISVAALFYKAGLLAQGKTSF